MLKKKVTLTNQYGLHIRAAIQLINRASRYGSSIKIIQGERQANAKKIMEVMSLGATKNTEIELFVEGEDEQAALTDLETLINNRFGEKE